MNQLPSNCLVVAGSCLGVGFILIFLSKGERTMTMKEYVQKCANIREFGGLITQEMENFARARGRDATEDVHNIPYDATFYGEASATDIHQWKIPLFPPLPI